MTEQEFRGLGLLLDPGDPTRAIAVAPQSGSVPDDTWDLELLGTYAETGLSEATRFQKESIQLGRRSTVQVFRSGHALSIAQRKVKAEKWGVWGRWLGSHNIKRTTAWEAIKLYQRAGSEEAIAHLMPWEAKRRYGIGKPPREVTEEPVESGSHREAKRPLNPSSESSSQIAGESDDGEPDAEPDDEPKYEPDVLVRPPRTVREMLIASSNLLLACAERSSEIDAACGDVLAEIETTVKRLRGEVTSCSTESFNVTP
jgi:hypothetical protein